jgi:hypothetical protein
LNCKDKKKIFSYLEENFPFFRKKDNLSKKNSPLTNSAKNDFYITDYYKTIEKQKMIKISHTTKHKAQSMWDIKVLDGKQIKVNKTILPYIKQ